MLLEIVNRGCHVLGGLRLGTQDVEQSLEVGHARLIKLEGELVRVRTPHQAYVCLGLG